MEGNEWTLSASVACPATSADKYTTNLMITCLKEALVRAASQSERAQRNQLPNSVAILCPTTE